MRGALKFPFQTARSGRLGLIRRPIIPCAFRGPGGSFEASVLLDSGADISLIPYSVGQTLGLSAKDAPRGECRGLGEALVAYHLCQVELKLGGLRLLVRVGWSTLEETPLLLGRLDVFDALDIEFRQSRDCIILRPARK
jgi:hypothetical protein